jgi:hypothetical protein
MEELGRDTTTTTAHISFSSREACNSSDRHCHDVRVQHVLPTQAVFSYEMFYSFLIQASLRLFYIECFTGVSQLLEAASEIVH